MTEFSYDELEYLFSIVEYSLKKEWRGKKLKYNPKDMFSLTYLRYFSLSQI